VLSTLGSVAHPEQAPKNVFKQISSDGWAAFLQRYPRYAAVDEVVQKMLGCGDPAGGHAVYLCPDCLERHVVAFSCKSQFCLSCAKVYGQNWVETVQDMLHPGVTYRHLILTVPEGLRTLIYQQAALLLDGLMQAAPTAMDAVVRQAKRQAVTLGYVVVLQTAGRSATYNPHLHVLLTDGGLRADGTWQQLPGNAEAAKLVAAMRRRYPRGVVDVRDRRGVEPTNNAAERALRPAVLWRKGCFGADSSAGNTFVAKILTASATCRQPQWDLLAYLTDAVLAHRLGRAAPPLLPTPSIRPRMRSSPPFFGLRGGPTPHKTACP
jgi:hypothetical protein